MAEDDLPKDQQHFLELNAELCADWPVITERKDPLPDADEWDGKPDKLALLERSAALVEDRAREYDADVVAATRRQGGIE